MVRFDLMFFHYSLLQVTKSIKMKPYIDVLLSVKDRAQACCLIYTRMLL